MNVATGDARPVGRPPGPHDDTLGKVLPTALALFLAEGGPALTPTRLHAETGVARATIYRNWPEPTDLIEVMLERATNVLEHVEPTGELTTDLHAAVAVLVDRFERKPVRALFAAGLEYGRRSSRVAAVAGAFVAEILQPVRSALVAAVEAGRIEGDAEELVCEVAGPLILEHIVLGHAVGRERGRAVVDHFLDHHLRLAGTRSRGRQGGSS